MDTQNTSRQLRYLEEVRIPLHRAGFGTLPLEGEQLPVLWNGTPLCRITGKGSVFYRREDADTPQAEDVLYRVEDIVAKTLEYMTAMETAPQLKASAVQANADLLKVMNLLLRVAVIHVVILPFCNEKNADSMVLRNQQTDALNFVKFFHEKSPLL